MSSSSSSVGSSENLHDGYQIISSLAGELYRVKHQGTRKLHIGYLHHFNNVSISHLQLYNHENTLKFAGCYVDSTTMDENANSWVLFENFEFTTLYDILRRNIEIEKPDIGTIKRGVASTPEVSNSTHKIRRQEKIIFSEGVIAAICKQLLQCAIHFAEHGSSCQFGSRDIYISEDGKVKVFEATEQSLWKLIDMREAIIDTPYYLSPEIIEGLPSPQTESSWRIGILAIEMAECNPPNSNYSPMAAMFHICNNPSPTLKDTTRWSPEFHDFLARALHKEGAQRASLHQLLRHPFIKKAADISMTFLSQEKKDRIKAFRKNTFLAAKKHIFTDVTINLTA